jgi:CheY-like chemotaxis protein
VLNTPEFGASCGRSALRIQSIEDRYRSAIIASPRSLSGTRPPSNRGALKREGARSFAGVGTSRARIERLENETAREPLPNPFHVLLVDDDASSLLKMRDWLTSARYRVSCHLGTIGLHDKIGALSPDLVVIDVLMPGLGSKDVAKLLAKHPASSNTPVLLRSPLHPKVLQRMTPIAQALGVIEANIEQGPFLSTIQAFANCIKLRNLLRERATSGTHRIAPLPELDSDERTGTGER